MALTLNEDTYATVETADTYISSYYPSTNTKRVAWEALAEEDKEVFLRNAMQNFSPASTNATMA